MKTFELTNDKYHGPMVDKKFNPITGDETVSVLVGRAMGLLWIRRSSEYEDGKAYLKYVACSYAGRSCDLDRCRSIGVRGLTDGRIEIRLRFDPPWYWSQIAREQHAASSGPTSTESGALGPV